jgi:hypothetical protein
MNANEGTRENRLNENRESIIPQKLNLPLYHGYQNQSYILLKYTYLTLSSHFHPERLSELK